MNGEPSQWSIVFTHLPWFRCELRPDKCADGAVRYADVSTIQLARHDAPGMNLANTPHFEGSQFQWQLVPNRRYMVDIIGKTPPDNAPGLFHSEGFAIEVGQALQEGEWIEFATAPYPAFPRTQVPPGVRPIGALPLTFKLAGWDGATSIATRPYREEDETFGGRQRQLSTGTVSWDPKTFQASFESRRSKVPL